MNKATKTLIGAASLVLAVLAVSGSANAFILTEVSGGGSSSNPGTCAVGQTGCVCATSYAGCQGTTGSECLGAVGPTRDTMEGLLCSA
jgi:hypothetical protein